MNWMLIARNVGISEFSEKTGIPLATLRDWNKRGLSAGIGQPGPNGHWLYSQVDMDKVLLASMLYGEGINWRTALFIGNAAVTHLEGRLTSPDEGYYRQSFLAFFGIDRAKPLFAAGRSYDEAVARARAVAGPTSLHSPFALTFDLEEVKGMLRTNYCAA